MTLAATALALYVRTKAQLRLLASPTPPVADHIHLSRPLTLTFPLHTRRATKRRPRRPLTTAIRHLLRSSSAPTPPARLAPSPCLSPLPAPSPSPPPAPSRSPNPFCRLCAATPA